MALVDSALAGVLKGIFADMRASASGSPRNDDWYADKLAKAITDQIKTADVNPGIAVDGGTVSGGALVGCTTSAIGTLS